MSKDQTTTTSQEPFSGVSAERFNALYPYLRERLGSVPAYGAPLSASLNPTQQAAISSLAGYAANPAVSAYATGQYLDPANNPYVKNMAAQIQKQTGESWTKMGEQINTAANKSGFWSGSGRQQSLTDSQKSLAEAESGALASLYDSAYRQNVADMLQANQVRQSAAEAALTGGTAQYQAEDTAAQRSYQEFLRQQGYSQQQIENLLSYFATGKNPTTTETTNDGGAGVGSLIGAIIACFPAGTPVECIGAPRPIETIRPGDVVLSPGGAGRVIRVDGPSRQPVIRVAAGEFSVLTTASQPFLTADGPRLPVAGAAVLTVDGSRLVTEVSDTGRQLDVYDIKVEGVNIYYAGGFAVEGGY